MKWILTGFFLALGGMMYAASPNMRIANAEYTGGRPSAYSTSDANESFTAWQDTANCIGWDESVTYASLSAIPAPPGKKGGGTLERRDFSQYLCFSTFDADVTPPDPTMYDVLLDTDDITNVSVFIRCRASVSDAVKFRVHLIIDGEIQTGYRETTTYAVCSGEDFATCEAFGGPSLYGYSPLSGADVKAENFGIAIVAFNALSQPVQIDVDGMAVVFTYERAE